MIDNEENPVGIYLFPVPLSDGTAVNVLPRRNIELLRGIKFFVVENIRSARRFLRSVIRDFDFDAVQMCELNEHTLPEEVEELLEPLSQGHAIGVLSEAGCPAVADPGADIVALAQRRGCRIFPLVGPSSILLSLMGSGFNGQQFTFRGYLPIDNAARLKTIREMERIVRDTAFTQIFIETPYRNNRLYADLVRTLSPDIRLCIASDITGEKQSIVTMPVRQWRSKPIDLSKTPTIFLINH